MEPRLGLAPAQAALLAVFLVPAWVPAQAQEIVIAGTVVDGLSGDPVRRAIVTLRGFREAGRPEPVESQTVSGAGGEFRFTVPSKGRYYATVQKAGYGTNRADSRKPAEVLGDKSVEGLRLAVHPLGVIEGKVLDDDGEPVRNARVAVIDQTVLDGVLRLRESKAMATDDLGEFRFWNVQPGRYFVRAEARWGGTLTMVGDAGSNPRVIETFSSRYADGARELASSSPVTVAYGSRVKPEFRVKLEPAFAISGTLTGIQSGELPRFELLRNGSVISRQRASFVPLTNRFELFDVPAGDYVLRISLGARKVESPVRAGAGVRQPSVALSMPAESAFRRTATITFRKPEKSATGTAEPPGQFGQLFRGRGASIYCQVKLVSADPDTEESDALGRPQGGDIWQWVFENLAPGRYFVLPHCGIGAAVPTGDSQRTVTSGGFLTLNVDASGPPAAMEFELDMTGGQVLVGCEGCEHAVFVPLSGVRVPFVRVAKCHQAEICEGLNLPPGDYQVHAFGAAPDPERPATAAGVAFMDPKILAGLQGGVRVHVENAGAPKRIEIKEWSK